LLNSPPPRTAPPSLGAYGLFRDDDVIDIARLLLLGAFAAGRIPVPPRPHPPFVLSKRSGNGTLRIAAPPPAAAAASASSIRRRRIAWIVARLNGESYSNAAVTSPSLEFGELPPLPLHRPASPIIAAAAAAASSAAFFLLAACVGEAIGQSNVLPVKR
jgi:hypothetical protein